MTKHNNIDHLRDHTPRMGNALSRGFGRLVLRLTGWKVSGRFPEDKKFILIGAPHTSNWDFVVAMGAAMALGLKFTWMMKKEAFFWPLGGVWKKLGGIPIDRKNTKDITMQMTEFLDQNDNVILGLTPEGTRSKVKSFKKGYLRMAYATGLPIFIVGISGQTKEIVLDRTFPLTGDTVIDNREIKKYYDRTYKGINPERG